MIDRKITIWIRGASEDDVDNAFDEAIERLRNGCISGGDNIDTSAFYFVNEDRPPGELLRRPGD